MKRVRLKLLSVLAALLCSVRSQEVSLGGVVSGNSLINSTFVYNVKSDLIVEPGGTLTVEAGATLKFSPGTGLIVRGALRIQGDPSNRARLIPEDWVSTTSAFPTVRLVDGDTPLEGRLQIFHNGRWLSVCTNSLVWTQADTDATCRHLGFIGGSFFTWMDRLNGTAGRPVLWEAPNCPTGPDTRDLMSQCDFSSRKTGPGVCGVHPDIALRCQAYHLKKTGRWRGIIFEEARFRKELVDDSYVKLSESRLHYVDVIGAGEGANFEVTPSIGSRGVAPSFCGVVVDGSAYTGVNITTREGPVTIHETSVKMSKGPGIFINSTAGSVAITSSDVSGNYGDGIRYVFHDVRADEAGEQISKIHDFCLSGTSDRPSYPLRILAESTKDSITGAKCEKLFQSRPGQILTLHFITTFTDTVDGANLELYDGPDERSPLIGRYLIKNGTRPQSVSPKRTNLFVKFTSKPRARVLVMMEMQSFKSKAYDINVTSTILNDNGGRGLLVENLRSLAHVQSSTIERNQYVAGVNVLRGAGDVNVTKSYFALNEGEGVNVTYSGGRKNISYTTFEANKGYGVSIWLNETSEQVAFAQETVVAYSVFTNNYLSGIKVGNYCRSGFVNVTTNTFNESQWYAVELDSCWRRNAEITKVFVGHNRFFGNRQVGLYVSPAVNMNGTVEHNLFKGQLKGCVHLRTEENQETDFLPAEFVVSENRFESNEGQFVASLGVSDLGNQRILFTRNWLKRNKVKQAQEGISPRSRVAAVVVISSQNVTVTRNLLENPDSDYEIGSHLSDPGASLNCSRNWLGSRTESVVYYRLFDRKDRYTLSRLAYKPFLMHDTNYDTDLESVNQGFVPNFVQPGTRNIGGEVEGQQELHEPGVYTVTRDITVHPNAKLTVAFGVTLKFEQSIGMMVAGELVAEGSGLDTNPVLFTLSERIRARDYDSTEVEVQAIESRSDFSTVRLVGGTPYDGRLQVKLEGFWGSVCRRGWSLEAAALACRDMGMTLDLRWNMEPYELPVDGHDVPVLMSNVHCTPFDTKFHDCRWESSKFLENICGHEEDVGLRCRPMAWGGIRFGITARKSKLRDVIIEKAGVFDYVRQSFSPALRVDMYRHVFENIRVQNNAGDGVGVVFSDLYYPERVANLKQSAIIGNKGNGVVLLSLGLKISDCTIEGNERAGIHYNPTMHRNDQRELIGWLRHVRSDDIIPLPGTASTVRVDPEGSKYLMTHQMSGGGQNVSFVVETDPLYVIGMQLIHPIQMWSTEDIRLEDFGELSKQAWDLKTNPGSLPDVSSTYRITVHYSPGQRPVGSVVVLLSSVRRSSLAIARSSLLPGPLPTLFVVNTKLERNERGFHSQHYNRIYSPDGNWYNLRRANESIQFLASDISSNQKEAILVATPHRHTGKQPLAEIRYSLNYTRLERNGRAISQYSRDLRDSSNLFQWTLQNVTVTGNIDSGFSIELPFVYHYDENHTHSVYIADSGFENNQNFKFSVDGHYAKVKLFGNVFRNNRCKLGLISITGMEKSMEFRRNVIEQNAGNFMIEFAAESQSDILGDIEANFTMNVVRNNLHSSRTMKSLGYHQIASYVLALKGVQKVNVTDNLFGDNELDYELLAGIHTARVDNRINVERNWWGHHDPSVIEERIFDFDDWNIYATANFRPYLIEPEFHGAQSVSLHNQNMVDLEKLGGRITGYLVLPYRKTPYIVQRDLTVMPGSTLVILPGVEMEFYPSVGILVLGNLIAEGHWSAPIRMRPAAVNSTVIRRQRTSDNPTVRLCREGSCGASEGFLEIFNATLTQWVPVCDHRFTEVDAEVVCRELGLETINVHQQRGRRFEYTWESLNRIWHWPEPYQCAGNELRLEDCPVRLDGEDGDYHHKQCHWEDDFVFISCGEGNLDKDFGHWGGIRISVPTFEHEHLPPHLAKQANESVLQFVEIVGAGFLHGEKSPAVQAVLRAPVIRNVNISRSASDGILLVSPHTALPMLDNWISDNLGYGLNMLLLNGESRDSDISSFQPLKESHLPSGIFGLLDACDPSKRIMVEERVLMYFQYRNTPSDCVKIFETKTGIRPLGFRLLQFNFVNDTDHANVTELDNIGLYSGDIYNQTSTVITRLMARNVMKENYLWKSDLPSLSVRVHTTGGSQLHGFVAEILALPVAAVGLDREMRHNISYSYFHNNQLGAIRLSSVGEASPAITMEWNRVDENGRMFWGNFSSTKAAITVTVNNMEELIFRHNHIRANQGGLRITADSSGAPTSLRAKLYNNVFEGNKNFETVKFVGLQQSPNQQIIMWMNLITRNEAMYCNIMDFDKIVANVTANHVSQNVGFHVTRAHGFQGLRVPTYQAFVHNSFYYNIAKDRDNRGTVLVGNSGHLFRDNVFYSPLNDFEMVAENYTGPESLRTPVDANYNWWGYNTTVAIEGRIRDYKDREGLLKISFEPYYLNNFTVLSGRCDPGYTQVGDTCLMYVGVPVNFTQAREFCKAEKGSMPYVMGNYWEVSEFIRSRQEFYDPFRTRIWAQHLDLVGKCSAFMNRQVQKTQCDLLLPFICEADPKIYVDALSWTEDIVTIVALGTAGAALLLVILCLAFWASKSRHRAAERLDRRNSIRASRRSLAMSTASLSEFGHARRGDLQQKLVTSNSRYDMSESNDSIEHKSHAATSVADDTQSYEIYETNNTMTLTFSEFDQRFANGASNGALNFENQGYREPPSMNTSRTPSEFWDNASQSTNISMNADSIRYKGVGNTLGLPDPKEMNRGRLGAPPAPPEPIYNTLRSVATPDYSRIQGRPVPPVPAYTSASTENSYGRGVDRSLDDTSVVNSARANSSEFIDRSPSQSQYYSEGRMPMTSFMPEERRRSPIPPIMNAPERAPSVASYVPERAPLATSYLPERVPIATPRLPERERAMTSHLPENVPSYLPERERAPTVASFRSEPATKSPAPSQRAKSPSRARSQILLETDFSNDLKITHRGTARSQVLETDVDEPSGLRRAYASTTPHLPDVGRLSVRSQSQHMETAM